MALLQLICLLNFLSSHGDVIFEALELLVAFDVVPDQPPPACVTQLLITRKDVLKAEVRLELIALHHVGDMLQLKPAGDS